MPAWSKISAVYWSYAVSIAHFSPRFFMSRRWWIRYLRGRLPGSVGVPSPEPVVAEAPPEPVLLVTVPGVLADGWPRRAARREPAASSRTWLGASCCTSARRRAPAGRSLDEGEALTEALLSYSADGSDR